jgi:hypothetical protein
VIIMNQAKVWKNLLLFLEGNLVGTASSETRSMVSTDGVAGRFPCSCECGSEAVFFNTKAVREWLQSHATHTSAGGPVVDFTYVRESGFLAAFEKRAETAVPAGPSEPRGDAQAVLEKIRKLQRLAANNPERSEALAASRKVAELLAKYGELLDEE